MIRLASLFEVDGIWPHIAEGMKECCDRSGGDITPDWLFMVCRRGEAFLYVIEGEGAVIAGIIVQVQPWGGERRLRILALCGHAMGTWIEALRNFDPKLGVDRAIFEGREGWGRIPGVRELRRVYEVDLGNGR